MKDCRRRTILALLLFAFSLVAARSHAAESDRSRQQQLLKSKLTLVFLFERDMPALAKQGNGLVLLETEIRDARSASPDAAGLFDLFTELQLRWAKLLLGRGDVDGALPHFAEVLKAGPDAGGYAEAAVITAGIYRDQAEGLEKAGDDHAALERYAQAEELFRRGGDEARATAVGQQSADLEAKEGLKAFATRDYDKAFGTLSSLAGRNRPGFAGSDGELKLKWMSENTGVITIRTLAVPAQVPGQSVTGLRIALKRVRNGDDITRPFAESFRWQTGDYRLELLFPDGKVVLGVPVNLTAAGGSGEIPSKLPDGMAFISAGGRVSKPFFIDKTEVTVGEFRRQFPSQNFKFGQADYPAHGIRFAEAQSYAEKVGKRLPSYDQWQRAAFGDSNHKYPWGSDDTIARHCNVGTPQPRAVGSFPQSPSEDYGLADMAGNVWEWLDDEHAIGGGFLDRSLSSPYKPPGWDKVIDFLREKRPSKRLYDGFGDPDQRKKYEPYHVRDDILGEVGFRCVLDF
jgi:tetratricopeptide (TPR) repeat protein